MNVFEAGPDGTRGRRARNILFGYAAVSYAAVAIVTFVLVSPLLGMAVAAFGVVGWTLGFRYVSARLPE